MPYSLILDLLFVGLLGTALVYMARLNRRLDALRAGRDDFEALVKRFTAATEQAQANIGTMKAAAEGAGKSLQEEIDRARGLREDLAFLAERANTLADQLELAIGRSRPAPAPSPAPQPVPSNVARMPLRDEPRNAPLSSGAAANAPAPVKPALSSRESELLQRLSTLR